MNKYNFKILVTTKFSHPEFGGKENYTKMFDDFKQATDFFIQETDNNKKNPYQYTTMEIHNIIQ